MAASATSNVAKTLFTGALMPVVGLGTWKSKTGEVQNAVYHAIKHGYRHIDCAHCYGNETEVGNGVTQAISEGFCTREELFITSKLWNTSHHREDVRPAIEVTLQNLNMEYLDLYLIHWPTNFQRNRENRFPKDDEGRMLYGTPDGDWRQTWPAMEALVDANLTRAIGVSNFNTKQMDEIFNNCRIAPAVLQVECHPYLTQNLLRNYCAEKNMVMTSYSPLGSPDRPWASENDPHLLQDPQIGEIAKRVGKTIAQVLIRFQIDIGNIVIPKSVTPSRIEQNFQVFDFELTQSDIELISGFNQDYHFCVPRITVNDELVARDSSHPEFPFGIDEGYQWQ